MLMQLSYHELSEFFLAWYETYLNKYFHYDGTPTQNEHWQLEGNDDIFSTIYGGLLPTDLSQYMPDNGLQIVMFTHQDAAVWADLSLIYGQPGFVLPPHGALPPKPTPLLNRGNYVQGTVLLVLRKRTEEETVFLDELNHKVEIEVKRQLDSMLALEDESDPNFGDADYQLAAYAAALRVLTERPIEEIDPSKELLRQRNNGEENPVEQLIRNAVKIACDYLVPHGIDSDQWKTLSPMERFYLKGIEVESHGEYRSGVYQELARGFAAPGYTDLLADTKANQTRLKTASEFGRKYLSGDGFAGSLVRQVLFAVHQVAKTEQTINGLNWLKTELPDYWQVREKATHLLDFIASLGRISGMKHWQKDAEAAVLVGGAVRNDHV